MIQSQELSLLLQHIPLPRFLFDRLSYAAVTGNRAWTGQKSGNCIPLPDGDRESKEEPMSEYRRDDTASWDAQEVRQAQGARREAASAHHSKSRSRRRRQNPLAVLVGYLIFVLLASAILAGVGWMLGSDFCAFNRGALRETSVEVTAEDSVSTVADKLQDAGLIKYKWFFKLYAGISHADKKIGIGTYTLNTEMDYRALILGMHNSSGNLTAETVTVTIPEGYTVRQTIRLLAEKGVNTEENLLEAAKTATYDYSFINNNSEDPSRLEGYLFPDTYEFYKNHNAKNALGKLIDAFADRIDEDAFASSKAKSMGYSMKDVVIIASLIEKETDGTDQRDIASVIYNRLQKPGETAGLLQIDASLLSQFASFPLESKENFCFVRRFVFARSSVLRIFAAFSAQEITVFNTSKFLSK